MEKYACAKKYGKAWHMFICPRAELWTPLLQQQVETFSPSLFSSNTHIDGGVILRLECFPQCKNGTVSK